MIEFEPTEEQQIMRDAVAQFAKVSLAEVVRSVEAAREVPESIRKSAHDMCLGMVHLPESCGGQGLGWVTTVLLEEQLGGVDAAAAFGLPGPGAFGTAVVELATEAQQAQWRACFAAPDAHDAFGAVAWSEGAPNRERPGLSTVADAHGDGYKLTGNKAFVLHAGLATRYLVFAQLDADAGWEGLGAFVVEADNPGLSVGERYDTLGLDAARFGAIRLDSAVVEAQARIGPADPADFTRALLRYFAKQSLIVAARAVGLSQHAFDLAREYCDTRVAFGKPIGHFQAVAFNLADRLMDVESARWLVWRAAWAWDSGKDEAECLLATSQAVAHTLEVAMRCGDDCVGLHGGAGFVRDVIAEKLMRDAKQLALCCPTSAQLDQLSAALQLGSELDPALLLPTPETQAIFT